jgi:hypothetical protein
MDDHAAPSLQQLRSLYDAAERFCRLHPWTWMDERDTMAVREPVSGDIMIMTAMGMQGICRGLSVSIGREGVIGYVKMLAAEETEEGRKCMLEQRSVTLDFGDRQNLMPEEVKRLAALGLEFRGKGSFPTFRSLVPGSLPWPVNAVEAAAMLVAMEQFMLVAEGVRDGQKKTRLGNDFLPMLVRECAEQEGQLVWTDSVLEDLDLLDGGVCLNQVGREGIMKSVEGKKRTAAIWELAFPWLDGVKVAGEGGRPYVPRVLLCVDRGSKLVLKASPSSGPTMKVDMMMEFIQLLLDSKQLPAEMRISDKGMALEYREAADAAGIKMTVVDRVPEAEKAARSLVKAMARKQGTWMKGTKGRRK